MDGRNRPAAANRSRGMSDDIASSFGLNHGQVKDHPASVGMKGEAAPTQAGRAGLRGAQLWRLGELPRRAPSVLALPDSGWGT
jgi:hypothetical protein